MRNHGLVLSRGEPKYNSARHLPLRSAFTLIEVMIVLVVVGILMTVLFQVYSTITSVSSRVRLQKDIGEVVVRTNIIMQNICDTHTLNYAALSGVARTGTPGILTTLPLLDKNGSPVTLSLQSGQLIETTVSGGVTQTVQLVGGDVVLDPAYFQITPLTDPKTNSDFNTIAKPGVWIAGTYHPAKNMKASFPFQTFYSFLSQ